MGHNGSVYTARVAPQLRGDLKRVIGRAERASTPVVIAFYRAGAINIDEANFLVSHAMMVALHELGYIRYTATLTPSSERTLAIHAEIFTNLKRAATNAL